jgi:hypothetical protein
MHRLTTQFHVLLRKKDIFPFQMLKRNTSSNVPASPMLASGDPSLGTSFKFSRSASMSVFSYFARSKFGEVPLFTLCAMHYPVVPIPPSGFCHLGKCLFFAQLLNA